MLKKIIIGLICLLPLTAMAQDLKFGHVNSREVMALMPQFKEAQTKLENLAKQYESELAKKGTDYEKAVQEFQALGADVSDVIKESRYKAIMDLQQSIEDIRKRATEQLQKEEETLVEPIVAAINKAIEEVGSENGFFYIFDASVPTILYYSPKSVDITSLLKKKLNIP
jgi:outer membrane protein